MPVKKISRRDGNPSISYSELISNYTCIYDTIETNAVKPDLKPLLLKAAKSVSLFASIFIGLTHSLLKSP